MNNDQINDNRITIKRAFIDKLLFKWDDDDVDDKIKKIDGWYNNVSSWLLYLCQRENTEIEQILK